jgi:hypothetical protein
MSLRATLLSTVGTLTLSRALLAPAPAGADPVIGPGPLDPVIELLPPLPVPYAAYDGKICRSGSDKCIANVVTEMKGRLQRLSTTCQHDAIFSLAYLRVTENVQAAQRQGYFSDRKWLNRLDAVFADLYFDVMDDWHSGDREGVPRAWRIALQAEDDRSMTGLGNFMLAMNAHINRDFPHVLAQVGLTAKNGRSHKSDHNRYNKRLDSLYGPVFKEEARRFDPAFDDIDIGPIEDTAAGIIMRGWREGVWRHAEALALSKTPAQRRFWTQEIEVYAATQAVLIKSLFGSGSSRKRDAWCADHGLDR